MAPLGTAIAAIFGYHSVLPNVVAHNVVECRLLFVARDLELLGSFGDATGEGNLKAHGELLGVQLELVHPGDDVRLNVSADLNKPCILFEVLVLLILPI